MKKLILDTKPRFIHNDNMYTVNFQVVFPVKTNLEETFNFYILNALMRRSKNDVREEEDFIKLKLDKMVQTNLSLQDLIEDGRITYSFQIPKDGCIKDYDIESAFKLACDILLNPAFDDGKADQKIFDEEVKHFKEVHDNKLQNIYEINHEEAHKIIDPEDELSLSYEHEGKVLENTTPETVYNYYVKNIKNNDFIIYVTGCYDEEKVSYLIDKYLKQEEKTLHIETNRFKPFNLGEYSYHEITNDFNQSELRLMYTVNDLVEEDKIYVKAITNILASDEVGLVRRKLRTEKNLVYNCHVSGASVRGYIRIIAYFIKDNKDAVKETINEVFESMKDKEFVIECIEKIKKGIEIDLLRLEDSLTYEVDKRIQDDFEFVSTQKLYDDICSIDYDKLMDYINKITLSTEIFFKGDKND